MERVPLLAILVLLVVAAIALAARVMAHEEARWIQDEKRYRGHDGVHCCGVGDCERVKADLVSFRSMMLPGSDVPVRGYMIPFRGREYFVAEGDHYGSIDEDFWMCGYGAEGVHRPGCAFVPRGAV